MGAAGAATGLGAGAGAGAAAAAPGGARLGTFLYSSGNSRCDTVGGWKKTGFSNGRCGGNWMNPEPTIRLAVSASIRIVISSTLCWLVSGTVAILVL